MTDELLEVDHLTMTFAGGAGEVRAVDDVSLRVRAGECVGVVGESGSGKSMLARTLLQLLPPVDVLRCEGSIRLEGRELLGSDYRSVRTDGLSMVFQEPLSYLNPTMRIGQQIAEGLPNDVANRDRVSAVRAALAQVELPASLEIERRYPHELSGGMRQRAMIALALATRPRVLIADEPTTALDVTVQAQLLRTLYELHRRKQMGLVIITHDLGIVANMCDRVYVMYAGQIVEEAETLTLFDAPQHPYTKALLDCRPGHTDRREVNERLRGPVPDLSALDGACRFRNRCEFAATECATEPSLDRIGEAHAARCGVLPFVGLGVKWGGSRS
ncbi:MAG: peptide ABC transporter ATP-binding protein [Acidimicrobiaceae bacterium]|nr:peptide ABC transporter ATP-binding protein [Acidimicrobiaceae bacterium]